MEEGSEKLMKRRLSRRMVLAGAAIAGAGLTAAASTEKTLRAAGVPIIDTHFHTVPPGTVDAVLANPSRFGVRVNSPAADGSQTITFLDQVQSNYTVKGGTMVGVYPPFTSTASDFYSNLKTAKNWLQSIGADGAVISTFLGWHRYTLPAEQKLALFRSLNDEAAKWIANEPMLKATASLPLPDGEASAAELRRATRDLKMKGAMIQTNLQVPPWNLDDPRLEPLWKEAEALDAPMYLHPSGGAGANAGVERLAGWGLNFLGNAIDTTIAASYLWASGVLDRYPKLKVVLPHGGGYFSVAYGRLSHYFYVSPTTTGKVAKEEASAYLKRFYYDTILHRPESLAYLIKLVGPDKVLFGTDYPFTNVPPDPIGQIRNLQITDAEKDTVLGSAAKLYGFV